MQLHNCKPRQLSLWWRVQSPAKGATLIDSSMKCEAFSFSHTRDVLSAFRQHNSSTQLCVGGERQRRWGALSAQQTIFISPLILIKFVKVFVAFWDMIKFLSPLSPLLQAQQFSKKASHGWLLSSRSKRCHATKIGLIRWNFNAKKNIKFPPSTTCALLAHSPSVRPFYFTFPAPSQPESCCCLFLLQRALSLLLCL